MLCSANWLSEATELCAVHQLSDAVALRAKGSPVLRTSALTQQSSVLRISITIRACATHILVGFLKVNHQFENLPVHVPYGISLR